MRKVFLILVAFVSFAACNNANKPPEGILSKEKMVGILLDMHIAEAQVNTLSINRDSSRLIFHHYEQEIYEEHNVADSIYLASYNYYLGQVKDMDEIYSAVVDSLSLRERLLNTE